MVGADRVAAFHVDVQADHVAHLDLARFDLGLMRVQAAERLGRIDHHQLQPGSSRDRARVAHLAAAFAIERGLVGEHGDLVTRIGGFDFSPVFQ